MFREKYHLKTRKLTIVYLVIVINQHLEKAVGEWLCLRSSKYKQTERSADCECVCCDDIVSLYCCPILLSAVLCGRCLCPSVLVNTNTPQQQQQQQQLLSFPHS